MQDAGQAAARADTGRLYKRYTMCIVIIQEGNRRSTGIPRLTAMRQEIDTAPEYFGWLTSSTPLIGDPAALREQMAHEGYLYLPGALHRDQVLAARREIA